MKEIYKQCELPRGAKVKINNKLITFVKMDGYVAHWIAGDEVMMCNFEAFEREGNYFVIRKMGKTQEGG